LGGRTIKEVQKKRSEREREKAQTWNTSDKRREERVVEKGSGVLLEHLMLVNKARRQTKERD